MMLRKGYVDLYHTIKTGPNSFGIHVRAGYEARLIGDSVGLELFYDKPDITRCDGIEREQAERVAEITPEIESIFWHQAVSRLFGRGTEGTYTGQGNLRKAVAIVRELIGQNVMHYKKVISR